MSSGSDEPEDGGTPGQLPLAETIRPDDTLQIACRSVEEYQAAKRRGSLLVIAGAQADIGTHVLVEEPVIIGREAAGLQLCDGRISRRHAMVSVRDELYMLTDLGSTNGSLLNGVRVVGEQRLRDGDKIFLGETVVKFTLVDPTEADYLRRMQRLAGTDELTGLLAKHRFDSLLERAVLDARSSGAPLSVLMMDMDGLKAINDRHGHHMGAHTIRCVGQLLGEILAGRGEGCRFGGDEFTAFLPGLILPRAKLVAERIRYEVDRAEFTLRGTTVKATISVGMAELSGDEPGEVLLARADEALYRAKARGRNTISE